MSAPRSASTWKPDTGHTDRPRTHATDRVPRFFVPVAPLAASPPPPRRSQWRQRLIDAEHGLRLSVRMDGTMFVHLFVASGVIAAAVVLGLAAHQWAVVILSITMVVSAETFHQMLRAISQRAGHHLPSELRDIVRIGSAAVLLASIGAGLAMALIFAQRLGQLDASGG